MDKSEDKNFLSRWSARKSAVRAREVADPDVAPQVPSTPEPPEPVNPAALPSVDDLTEDSDYTVFLRKGVPDTMRKAALRKLWVTEPSVVNYRPLVEYAWHNNEPGFGPLLPTDNVQAMLDRIFGGTPEPAAEPGETAGTSGTGAADAQALEAASEVPADIDAPRPDAAAEEIPVAETAARRRHGGALPS